MNLLTKFNKKQKQAVEAPGNVIIIAGPGTGKTRTLTHKIAYLLQEKLVDPREIVALTFTKKAAMEMSERVDGLIYNSEFLISKQTSNPIVTISKQSHSFHPFLPPRGGKMPFVGTFHSLAFEILKNNGIKPNIVSETEFAEIIQELCGKYSKVNRGLSDQEIKRYISLFKTGTKYDYPEDFGLLVTDYNARLEKTDLLDYDDMLLKTLETIKKEKINFQYILVDEFQDTNVLQYKLVKQLLNKKGSLFVIGDPKQSIYAFRGSNEKIFEKFEADFPDAQKIKLDINYRSAESIIKTSQSLFADTVRLTPYKKEKGSVKLVETYNQYSEADWILKEINNKVGGIDLNRAADVSSNKQTYSFADFAIVYRVHSINQVLVKKLYEFGIPFQIVGAHSLYEQKEIKFVILALKSLVSEYPDSRLSEDNDRDAILKQIRELKAVDDPESLILEKLDSVNKVNTKLNELVKEIVRVFSLEKSLEKNNTKLQNLKEFVGSTIRFNKHEEDLVDFLKYVKRLEEYEYYDHKADKVTLMSMHAAKGLEFSIVYIIGFEDGIIPYKKSVEEDNIDEEKRLLYVAMTRAEQELQILFSQKRYRKKAETSRFFKNLSDKNIGMINDPQIVKIKKKIERSRKKQLQLF